MFNKKNDPVVDSVRKVMEQNQIRRNIETSLCEELGIHSRDSLPHNKLDKYDEVLAQRIDEALGSTKDVSQNKQLNELKDSTYKSVEKEAMRRKSMADAELDRGDAGTLTKSHKNWSSKYGKTIDLASRRMKAKSKSIDENTSPSLDDVMEEIKSNLGEEKFKKIAGGDSKNLNDEIPLTDKEKEEAESKINSMMPGNELKVTKLATDSPVKDGPVNLAQEPVLTAPPTNKESFPVARKYAANMSESLENSIMNVLRGKN